MKLLFVADQPNAGAAERHLVTLATGLARRGHTVTVATLHDGVWGAPLEAGAVVGGCCLSQKRRNLSALARLAGLVDASRPSLMLVTSPYSHLLAALARLRTAHTVPLADVCHPIGVMQAGRWARLRALMYRQLRRQVERQGDCVIVGSCLQRDFFAATKSGIRRVEVIHDGIDLEHFSEERVAGVVPVLRARYALTRADLVIGLCGNFRPEARHVDLLEAVSRLRALGLPVKVVLVGDGPLRPAIEAAVKRLGLRASVLLAGYQSDVRPYIAMCDVMVRASHSETFPIATLESMALARPVVASDVCGMREQITHERNGLLYRAGDIGALAAALARVANPGLRAKLGQGALAAVHARFDARVMLARYEALLLELAHAHAPVPAPVPRQRA